MKYLCDMERTGTPQPGSRPGESSAADWFEMPQPDRWPDLDTAPPLDITDSPPLDLNADSWPALDLSHSWPGIEPPDRWQPLDITDSPPLDLNSKKGRRKAEKQRTGETLNAQPKRPRNGRKRP